MFYRKFLTEYKDWCNLTTNEQIVYSVLLNTAIVRQDCIFENDGSNAIDKEVLYEYLDNEDTLGFYPISYKKIAEKSGVSLRSLKGVDGIIHILEIKGLLRCYSNVWEIVAPKDLIDGGYMMLPTETGLKGKQLIFWAFICERLKHFNENKASKTKDSRWLNNKAIDTWASKLAEDFGVKTKDIQNLIHWLTKRNFVRRAEDGVHLWINIELKNIVTKESKSYGKDDLEF